jgi:hypothetical protein
MRTVSYSRHRFPADVIQHAVWLCFQFPLLERPVITAFRRHSNVAIVPAQIQAEKDLISLMSRDRHSRQVEQQRD